MFPLLPWAGYAFLGASFGSAVGAMKSVRELWTWLGLLFLLGAVLWWNEKEIAALYPPHHFWVTNPANAARRWTSMLVVLALLLLGEHAWPARISSPALRWLSGFGAASLAAYFFHEMLLFQRHIGIFALFFRGRADWPLFWALLLALIAATWVCVRLFGWGKTKVQALIG